MSTFHFNRELQRTKQDPSLRSFSKDVMMMLAACLRVHVATSTKHPGIDAALDSRFRLSIARIMINAWASIYGAMLNGDDDDDWKQVLTIVDMLDEYRLHKEKTGFSFYGIIVDPEPVDRSFELGLSSGQLAESADMVRFRMQCRGDMLEAIREIFIRYINSGSLANGEPWRPRVKHGVMTQVLSDARLMLDEDSPFLSRLAEVSKRMQEKKFFYSLVEDRPAWFDEP